MNSVVPAASPDSFKFDFPSIKNLAVKTVTRFSDDSVPRLAASFSFYAILSLSPLLVLAVTVAGIFISGAQNHLLHEASGYVGPQGADFLKQLIHKTQNPNASIIATISSLVVTFFSASNLFFQLDDAMNAIWGIRTSGPFLKTLIKTWVVSFFGVVLFGLLIVGLLLLDSFLRRLSKHTDVGLLWQVTSLLLTTVVLVGGFGVSFKSLPNNKLAWRDVWPAAVVTAIGFVLSKFLLNEYFALAGLSAAYGAAGALVVVLLWIYYTSQIYFFGAEMAFVWAHEYGSMVTIKEQAPEETKTQTEQAKSEA